MTIINRAARSRPRAGPTNVRAAIWDVVEGVQVPGKVSRARGSSARHGQHGVLLLLRARVCGIERAPTATFFFLSSPLLFPILHVHTMMTHVCVQLGATQLFCSIIFAGGEREVCANGESACVCSAS